MNSARPKQFFEVQKVPARGLKLHLALSRLEYQSAVAETAAVLRDLAELRSRVAHQSQGRCIPLKEFAAWHGVKL